MRLFRRYRAQLLAAVVVMLMLSWGFTGVLSRSLRSGSEFEGRIDGEKVTSEDLREAVRTVDLGARLGFLNPGILFAIQYGPGSRAAKSNAAVLATDFRSFIGGEESGLGDEAFWRCLVLLREVDKQGIAAAPIEVRELLVVPPMMNTDGAPDVRKYNQFLSQIGMDHAEMTHYMGRLISIAKLITLRRETILASRPEFWARYYYESESLRLRFVRVDADLFLPLVDRTPEELKTWYEDHLDGVGDPEAGVIGYMAPRRVKVECAMVPMERLLAEAVVTDEEVAAYYEENKARYRDWAAQPEEEDAEKEPQYKPLEDVREGIVQTLKERAALKAANELIDVVAGELSAVSADYVNEALPLAQMARRYGLDYRVVGTDDGRQFLSREELEVALPDGEAVGTFALDEGDNRYNPQRFGRSSTPLICQVLDVREPEPRSYEEVERQVRNDYSLHAALQSAQTFAEKLSQAADESDLTAAAAQMDGALKALAGGMDLETPLLEARESEAFARTADTVPGIPGSGPEFVREAFALAPGQVGMKVEDAPVSKCYVFEVIERSAPSEMDLGGQEGQHRTMYLYEKQGRELRRWFDGLLANAERVEREAKEEGE